MHLPSEEIYNELRIEPGGIWFEHTIGSDTHAILLKSTSNILKALIKGAPIKIGFNGTGEISPRACPGKTYANHFYFSIFYQIPV